LICHTGKQGARDGVIDQYAARGGSALADGARMVTVLQAWHDNEKLTPPAGFTLKAGEQGIVMARAKISYAPPQPLIWLKRRGWTFEHFIDMPATKEAEPRARADQVWRYLADQLKSGAPHTKTDLEGTGILPQKKLRAALSSLLVGGRVVYKPLPEEQRHGGAQRVPASRCHYPVKRRGHWRRGSANKLPLSSQPTARPLPRRHPIGKTKVTG
jgi:hypothetical protein